MGSFDSTQQGTEIDANLVPARMLNELVYCPRLFYLEHVAGEWAESADTFQGKRVHNRVDAATSALPPATRSPTPRYRARSVTVSSEAEGIIAKTDLVEADDGAVVPVDYKRGAATRPRPGPRRRLARRPRPGRRPGARAPRQRLPLLSCRGLLRRLEAARPRRPHRAQPSTRSRAAVVEARRVRALPVAPPPLVASPKCPRCSLVGICLPDEITSLLAGPEPPDPDEPSPPRQIPTPRPGRRRRSAGSSPPATTRPRSMCRPTARGSAAAATAWRSG